VEDVGPGVSTVKPGERVVMHWRKGPGIEAKPPKYKWDKSFTGVGDGWRTVGAGPVHTFNEMAVVSENRLTKVSDDIPFEVAALMGCAVTTALGLVCNEAKVRLGESVAVAGCGGVGLMVIQGALLAGANPVYAVDCSDSARTRALLAGASCASGQPDGLPQVDVFVDCTGDCGMIALGYELIRPETGRMILVGQPRHDACLSIPGFRRHYQGKTVMDSQGGLTNPAEDIPRYLGLFKAGRLPLMGHVTHSFPLEKVNEALGIVRAGEAGRCILTM